MARHPCGVGADGMLTPMAEQFLSGRRVTGGAPLTDATGSRKVAGTRYLACTPSVFRKIEAPIFEYPFETMRQPVRPNVERLRRRKLVGMNYEELHLLIDKPRGIGICC